MPQSSQAHVAQLLSLRFGRAWGHNYQSPHALEPVLRLQWEKPAQWEAQTGVAAPDLLQVEESPGSSEDAAQPK